MDQKTNDRAIQELIDRQAIADNAPLAIRGLAGESCVRPRHCALHPDLLRCVPRRALYPVPRMLRTAAAKLRLARVHVPAPGLAAHFAVTQRQALCIEYIDPYGLGAAFIRTGCAGQRNQEHQARRRENSMQPFSLSDAHICSHETSRPAV